MHKNGIRNNFIMVSMSKFYDHFLETIKILQEQSEATTAQISKLNGSTQIVKNSSENIFYKGKYKYV